MDITEVTLIHHVGIVLAVLWLLSHYNCCHAFAYFFSLIYLFVVHERYVMRLRRKLQFEERKQGNQRRVLSDSETVRWLNYAVEKIWPICIEQIASQRVLLPIIPWFLEKYKPWTVSKGVLQHLYLGRNPPMFTEMRVLRQSTGDDHLVLELGMNFLTADDMLGILAVKLKKRLGFGMWAKLHITGMHIEGKVMIGVKFLRKWPFLGRVRLCFVEPPYFQMTVKPIFTRGLDVTEVPGIDGWLDKLLSIAFEQTLVQVFGKLVSNALKKTLIQPNMLVVDMEKFVSPEEESWFSVDEKKPVAHLKVEVIEASNLKASDLNGFADPYVKGQFGVYQFKTKIQKKTLAPKWFEEFKIPVISWDSNNVLAIDVHDKDIFVDDTLGNCSIKINDLRHGARHDMWLALQNIKTAGRLHLAVTVLENNGKGSDIPDVQETETPNMEGKRNSVSSETPKKNSFLYLSSEKSPRVADNYEPIDVEGQKETGIWVHHPGSEVSQTWEARKGKGRRLNTQIQGEPNGSSVIDETQDDKRPMQSVRRGLRKLGSVFHRNPKKEDNSSSFTESVKSPVTPRVNLRAVNCEQESRVKVVVEDDDSGKASKERASSSGESSSGSPGKGKMKGMAKSFYKHAEKSVKHALSRKGSRKSQTDDREIAPRSNPSDDDDEDDDDDDEDEDDSRTSQIVKMIPIVSRDIPRPPGNDSFKSDEHLAQPLATSLSDIAEGGEGLVKMDELEDAGKMPDKPDNPEKNDEVLFEPLKDETR